MAAEGRREAARASPAFVAHCPSTSLLGGQGWMAHGVIPDLAAAGTELVLGTDAAAISRFLDLVRVMYLAAVCHKDARRDHSLMPVTSVFEMATVNAAKALRAADRLGSAEAGKPRTSRCSPCAAWLTGRSGSATRSPTSPTSSTRAAAPTRRPW
ncbi:amidohydrolase family protein [Amycolatopsis carbonis]|uniref:Amidohydrolase family protein n=1 Tax=Amycolatopsis carbonis TaxID=715471 RepID=A0A9Y2IQG1_9PSEU|nr:amidohydrolase family protein [Amycolatopsis sp. 2-15]WIX83536.1 amidohydrolase family protein [Amycolatopsis sp. 2-15]